MASDSVFDSLVGADYLPPSPLLPLDPNAAPPAAGTAAGAVADRWPAQPVVDPYAFLPTTALASSGAAQPAASGTPPNVKGGQSAGLDVLLAPPAAPGQGGGWGSMPPIIANALNQALAPQGNAAGLFGPNTGRFMSALGAGLSSAGQNWNKPALAAFASGAGAAIQGGQQNENQQQEAKLKALQTAIAAWKVGDMATYHQALANYHTAVAQQRFAQMTPPAGTRVAPPSGPLSPNAAAPTPSLGGPGQGTGAAPLAPPAIVYGGTPSPATPAPPPAAAAPATGAPPARPAGVPPDSSYSPSRKMWRSSDGRLFDASGQAVAPPSTGLP
ncbi:MAG TPA: hypothetical protein VEK73_12760 [Xanthobacteraceae bacterium]|nr:hypothetical protein [Xanthobacteraceae bacterium]